MKLQELLIHSLWFIMAAFFAGNSHANNQIPVSEASHNNTFIAQQSVTQQEYVESTQANTAPTPPHSAVTIKNANQELLSKIESLQDEMQKLRGRLEVQNHDMQVMRAQQQALYRDLDSRLAKAESTTPKTAAQSKPKTNQITEEANDNGDAFYQAAYQMLQNKQYPRAISAFQVFLKNYPNSHYAANAHYWLGELYLSQGFIDKAKQEFNLVIKTYPKSSKVPAALLKLGFAHYDNGEWQKARETLLKVKQTFPDTDTARMAASRISDMDQQGL